jgi:hypothetical protein
MVAWLSDANHDAAQREARIAEMASAAGREYSIMECEAIEECLATLESRSGGPTQPKREATFHLESQNELLKPDFAPRLPARCDEPVEIRAAPQQIAAYILECGGRHLQSVNAADANVAFHQAQGAHDPFPDLS